MRQRANMIATRVKFSVSMLGILLIAGCASSPAPQQPPGQQKTFKSPQAAVNALVAALGAHDTNQLKQIFGPAGGEIVSSGDAVADQYQANKFLAAYDRRRRWVWGLAEVVTRG